MTFTPSDEQEAFFEELRTGITSILLEASAGSGKTTTIVHGTVYVPQHVLVLFVCFNKRIDEHIGTLLPRHIQHGTFHSRALKALSNSLPKRPRIDGDKVRGLLKSQLKWHELELYAKFVTRLVGLAKNSGIGIDGLMPDTFANWEHLAAHFSLSLDSEEADYERAITLARSTLVRSNAELGVVDFDDMLYLALLRKARFDKCNFIFVDEAQDTNGVQRELLKLMLALEGRLIAVGDPFQGIYGFRGADASAMELLASDFGCKRLPLSTCYRCSRSVIAEVHNVLPRL